MTTPSFPFSRPSFRFPSRSATTAAVIVVVLALAVAWTTPVAAQQVEREVEETIDASGASDITIVAQAGSLVIQGESTSTVTASGTIRSRSESGLDRAQLITKRDGDRVTVRVEIEDGRRDRTSLDLVVRVPNDVALDVVDSSGNAEIEGTAAVKVTDSSGDVRLTDVGGAVRVTDSSGNLTIDGIEGAVRLTDSSGDVRLAGINGVVRIDVDSSGDIEIEGVNGNVGIGADSSGDIDVRDVEGSVTVGQDGSGSIRVRGISGDFTVRKDGSGNIRHQDVGGTVSIPED